MKLPLAVLLSALAAGCASAPEGGAADVEASRSHLEKGRELAGKNRHAEAVEAFTRAVKAHPDGAEAYFERGCSGVRLRLNAETQGDSRELEEKALRDFSAAIRLNPAFGKAYFNRAMVFASRAQFRAAAEDLLNACQYDAKNAEAHLQLGRLYEEKFEDRGIAALEHYDRYAELGGRDAATLDKVRAWREIKKQAAPAVPPSKAPTVDDEKKAAELHDEFKRLFRENKKAEALKLIETLLGQYGGTAYVRERAREFSALLAALKK
jgi:tetratricopeptide (TPR) repeat protein